MLPENCVMFKPSDVSVTMESLLQRIMLMNKKMGEHFLLLLFHASELILEPFFLVSTAENKDL